MNEAGNHLSQQTNTRTENQTPHVLTNKWELNNKNTGRETSHSRACWGVGLALGKIANVDDGLLGAANHHDTCTPELKVK